MTDEPRRVLMTTEVMDRLFTRDHLGNRLSVEGGEPDADGFYTPTITVHYDDNISVDAWLASVPALYAVDTAIREVDSEPFIEEDMALDPSDDRVCVFVTGARILAAIRYVARQRSA